MSSYLTSGDLYTTRVLPDIQLTYNDIYRELSDCSLPIIPKEDWEKIMPMLDSSDGEVIKVAFGLMQGFRFPPGVINLMIINKSINTFLKTNIYNN